MKISALPIYKLTATGNDFLLVNLLRTSDRNQFKKEKTSRTAFARRWCHRQEGLGADGLVFIEKDRAFDFAWDFYNSDGSPAEMCGNAARAVSLYASTVLKKKEFGFRSVVGEVRARVGSAQKIEVRLPKILEEKWNQNLDWKGSRLGYHIVRAGVPHAVVNVPSLSARAELRDFAHAIKNLPEFAKDGTNVTFVHPLGSNKVESVTFERGVEDFTLSCGTGAIASAYTVLRGEEKKPVEVQVPGGKLIVVWKDGQPHLRGPARIVAEMHLCR